MKPFFCCKTSSDIWFSFSIDHVPDEFEDYKVRSNYYSIPYKTLNSFLNIGKLSGVDNIPYEDIVYIAVDAYNCSD